MALVSIIPNLELALPAISGLFVAVIVIEVDKKWALGVWAAVSLLSLTVVPNKAAAIIYAVFFGYYPVLKSVLESKRRARRVYYKDSDLFGRYVAFVFSDDKIYGHRSRPAGFSRQVGDTRDSAARHNRIFAL